MSPLRASRATWALNAAVWTFRLPAITPPLLDHQSSLTRGPVFGVVRRYRRTRHPSPREEGTRAIVSWVIRLTRNRRGQGEQSLPEKRGADRQRDARPARPARHGQGYTA